jgi:hypothetical protein
MTEEKIIRKQLLDLLQGGSAHMGFDAAVAGFPSKFINKKPPNVPYTFWHLLEHMRIAQRDILEFIQNPRHVSPDWPQGYWPPKDQTAGKGEWEKTIEGIRADLTSAQKIVKSTRTDLFAPMHHAKKYTVFREILLIVDHNAYHIGEFVILRQVMNISPPDKW